jgi:hypothetical protein
MTTAEFLARLEQHRDHRLAFGAGGSSVAPGYHVTEIKAATIHAVDCGGRSTAWNETTLQLSSPEGSDGAELMGVAKFLSIYDRVGTMAPIDAQARLRVEYGPPGEVAVSYVVTDVVPRDDGVLDVRLAAPAVACKGRDRTIGDIPLVDAAAPSQGRTRGVGRRGVGRRGARRRYVRAARWRRGGHRVAPSAARG